MVRLPLQGRLARRAHAPSTMLRLARVLVATACIALACLALAGCSPEPPEKERKPEPQAAQAVATPEAPEAVQAPIDRARAVEGQLEEAQHRQRDAVEEAGG